MIYLLGGSGYVGQAYQAEMRRRGIEFKALPRHDDAVDFSKGLACDLVNPHPQRATFLINCAGYTGKPNVEAAEREKADCLFTNAVLPGRIADVCEYMGIPWAHVSSGCIYTGTRPDWQPWREDDPPNFCFGSQQPGSFYSGTKALGEQVLAGRPNCYIWRLRVPFDNRDMPRNFLTKLKTWPKLLDVTDSLSSLTDFVSATLDCWQKRVPFGTYNVVNPGFVNKREVIELMRNQGVWPTDREPVFWQDKSEYMRELAKTPRSDCLLDSSKLARTGIVIPDVRSALERDLSNWQPSP